jgi:hypothetical protein
MASAFPPALKAFLGQMRGLTPGFGPFQNPLVPDMTNAATDAAMQAYGLKPSEPLADPAGISPGVNTPPATPTPPSVFGDIGNGGEYGLGVLGFARPGSILGHAASVQAKGKVMGAWQKMLAANPQVPPQELLQKFVTTDAGKLAFQTGDLDDIVRMVVAMQKPVEGGFDIGSDAQGRKHYGPHTMGTEPTVEAEMPPVATEAARKNAEVAAQISQSSDATLAKVAAASAFTEADQKQVALDNLLKRHLITQDQHDLFLSGALQIKPRLNKLGEATGGYEVVNVLGDALQAAAGAAPGAPAPATAPPSLGAPPVVPPAAAAPALAPAVAPPVGGAGDWHSFLQQRNRSHFGPNTINKMDPSLGEPLAKLIQMAPPEIRDKLIISSGWRDPGDVTMAIRHRQNPTMVADPRSSFHGKGRAADLGFMGYKQGGAPPGAWEWLHANAPKVGLDFPLNGKGNMPLEAWHIEPASNRGGAKAAAAGGGFSGNNGFLSSLVKFESSGINQPNVSQGTSSGQAQGFLQITTGTWADFAPKAGVDLSKYPNPLKAPYAVQAQVAANIPMNRWAPETLNKLQKAGYTIYPTKTLAENVKLNGGDMAGGIEMSGLRDKSAPATSSDWMSGFRQRSLAGPGQAAISGAFPHLSTDVGASAGVNSPSSVTMPPPLPPKAPAVEPVAEAPVAKAEIASLNADGTIGVADSGQPLDMYKGTGWVNASIQHMSQLASPLVPEWAARRGTAYQEQLASLQAQINKLGDGTPRLKALAQPMQEMYKLIKNNGEMGAVAAGVSVHNITLRQIAEAQAVVADPDSGKSVKIEAQKDIRDLKSLDDAITGGNPAALAKLYNDLYTGKTKQTDIGQIVGVDLPVMWRKIGEVIDRTAAGKPPSTQTLEDAKTQAEGVKKPPMVNEEADIGKLGLKSGDTFMGPDGHKHKVP